jgi:hypothetical protein
VNRGAILGAGPNGAETYRYMLSRSWDDCGSKPMVFVMLNPSTADAYVDDQTIRRCIHYARREGYCSIQVVNLMAWRATDPKDIPRDHHLARGEDNHRYVQAAIKGAGCVVVAWGNNWRERGKYRTDGVWPRYNVEQIARDAGVPMLCLGKTKIGEPRHPSRLGNEQPLEPWDPFGWLSA